MARTRVLSVLALAAALVTPVSADAAPAQLTASTTIVATTTGYVDVYLARDVKLSPKKEGNPDVAVSGRGRMIGFSMFGLTTDNDKYSGLEAYRLPAFAGGRTQVNGTTVPAPVCTPFPHPLVTLWTDCTSPSPTAILLRRGTYRLQVLTDGAPVTVRLNLRGLSARSTTVRPTRALFSTQRDLPQLETVGDRLVTFGATTLVPPVQVSVTVLATGTAAASPRIAEKSACLRRDAAVTPPLAYSPACAGGESSAFWYSADIGGEQVDGGIFGGSSADESITRIGVGGSLGDSGGVKLNGALAVVVESTY